MCVGVAVARTAAVASDIDLIAATVGMGNGKVSISNYMSDRSCYELGRLRNTTYGLTVKNATQVEGRW